MTGIVKQADVGALEPMAEIDHRFGQSLVTGIEDQGHREAGLAQYPLHQASVIFGIGQGRYRVIGAVAHHQCHPPLSLCRDSKQKREPERYGQQRSHA